MKNDDMPDYVYLIKKSAANQNKSGWFVVLVEFEVFLFV